jgi:hypothetical protein
MTESAITDTGGVFLLEARSAKGLSSSMNGEPPKRDAAPYPEEEDAKSPRGGDDIFLCRREENSKKRGCPKRGGWNSEVGIELGCQDVEIGRADVSGRQNSRGTFSGNAVKSLDIPVKSPEKTNFSGNALRTHTLPVDLQTSYSPDGTTFVTSILQTLLPINRRQTRKTRRIAIAKGVHV